MNYFKDSDILGWLDTLTRLWTKDTPTPTDKVATPIAQPNSGSLTYGTNVKLLCLTPGATIRYTVDGSTPDEFSTLYVSSIAITQNTVLKAIAFKTNYEDSDIGVFTYTVKVSNPVATPNSSHVYAGTQIVLSCETLGASIRYSINGGPWSLYQGPITISSNTSLRIQAYKTNCTDSDIVEYNFQVVDRPDKLTSQAVVTSLKDIQLVNFDKLTNIMFLDALECNSYTTGEQLLIQKIVKHLLTAKGSNLFDSSIGSHLYRLTGGVNDDQSIVKTTIDVIIKDTIKYIKADLRKLENQGSVISKDMKLETILVNSITFDNNVLQWVIKLTVVTEANKTLILII